jgi:hypothetical protein
MNKWFEQEYNNAIALLWEKHCKYPQEQPWPPSATEIQEALEDRRKDRIPMPGPSGLS